VPWLDAGVNLSLGSERTSAVWEHGPLLVVLNYTALSFAIAISLWGTGRIVARLDALWATTPTFRDFRELFRGLDSALGPLCASLAAAVVFGVTAFVRDGWSTALVRGVTWFVIGIALFTFVWTYAALLLGLNRLGRERLVPDAMNVDPGLGLQLLGSIASTDLWMLLALLVSVLVTGLPDVVGAVVGMFVLVAALATFFLSMLRLHWQMSGVKARELVIARELYAQAYQPVHEARTLETLEQQRNLMAAADALEKRANAKHEWPFSERTPTIVITVATSVTAMTIGRLILDPIGLWMKRVTVVWDGAQVEGGASSQPRAITKSQGALLNALRIQGGET
jgi:hypothetical protein